jgi:hypothetical protein
MLRLLLGAIILTAAFQLVVFAAEEAKDADLFDKPVIVTRMPIPPDPLNPHRKSELSCFQYPNFAVKQIDRGSKGAEQLSIVPVTAGKEFTCAEEPAANEMAIQGAEWSGYFKGVKGNFVFVDADDGVDGGMGFGVFEPAHGKKLFVDLATLDGLHSLSVAGKLTLRYTRIYRAPCSLYETPESCWPAVQQKTGITNAREPDCIAAYKASAEFYRTDVEKIANAPSVIKYEVEATLDAGRTTVIPIPGKLGCGVAD